MFRVAPKKFLDTFLNIFVHFKLSTSSTAKTVMYLPISLFAKAIILVISVSDFWYMFVSIAISLVPRLTVWVSSKTHLRSG